MHLALIGVLRCAAAADLCWRSGDTLGAVPLLLATSTREQGDAENQSRDILKTLLRLVLIISTQDLTRSEDASAL